MSECALKVCDAVLLGPSAYLFGFREEPRRAHDQLGEVGRQVLGQLRIDPLALRSGQMENLVYNLSVIGGSECKQWRDWRTPC